MADHPENIMVIPSTGDVITLTARQYYAETLYKNAVAGASRRPLDDLREAVTTLEYVERTARRVFGGANPISEATETSLRNARAALIAREGDDVSSVCEAVEKITMRK